MRQANIPVDKLKDPNALNQLDIARIRISRFPSLISIDAFEILLGETDVARQCNGMILQIQVSVLEVYSIFISNAC